MLAILIAMVLVALIGSSLASTSEYSERNTTFNFEQSVQGNGYFMTYLYAKAGNSALKNYAHGSGSLNSELLMTYQNLNRTTHNTYSDFNDFDQNCIQFNEDVAMVYAPMKISVGNGYYAANPLDYSSLLKEKTWVKNYRAGTSMHHEVEYAHALDKELNIVIKDKRNYTYDPVWEGIGYTSMTINEDVTDGKAHIGVLQANENLASQTAAARDLSDSNIARMGYSAWRKPSIEIDEDYWGTYHIEKNMTIEVPYYIKRTTDDWLPCCFGGYQDPTYPKTYMGLKSAKGIFDCTCFKAPTIAQFPRVYNP